MPRYFFHLSDGKQVLNNHKGIDLSGNAAAREDALVLARDLKHGAVMPGWDWGGWFVMIVDAHGRKVSTKCRSRMSKSVFVSHQSLPATEQVNEKTQHRGKTLDRRFCVAPMMESRAW